KKKKKKKKKKYVKEIESMWKENTSDINTRKQRMIEQSNQLLDNFKKNNLQFQIGSNIFNFVFDFQSVCHLIQSFGDVTELLSNHWSLWLNWTDTNSPDENGKISGDEFVIEFREDKKNDDEKEEGEHSCVSVYLKNMKDKHGNIVLTI
ncbi:hypothetical protein RFI_13506, partial [Reticulomyxa filosa]